MEGLNKHHLACVIDPAPVDFATSLQGCLLAQGTDLQPQSGNGGSRVLRPQELPEQLGVEALNKFKEKGLNER